MFLFYCHNFITQHSVKQFLQGSINRPSNHRFNINMMLHLRFIQMNNDVMITDDLMNGVRIGLTYNYTSRPSDNPSFSTHTKLGIAQQLEKCLMTGIVL